MESKNLDRRTFLKGGIIAGAAAATAGLAGCGAAGNQQNANAADPGDASTSSVESENTASDYASQAAETVDTEIVVVGSGIAGLAAAVEASNNGADVVLLESQNVLGGSGMVTYGIFGVQSKMSQEQGITLTPIEVIKREANTLRYRTNGPIFRDMVYSSGANIDWLVENGVQFSGVVDNYMTDGVVPTYHWWSTPYSGEGYVTPMGEKAASNGVNIMMETAGAELIQAADGAIVGIYAQDSKKNIIQINAKAVILATGGFEQNKELMASRGYDIDQMIFIGMNGHDGSGHDMAFKAGAKSWMDESCLIEYPANLDLGWNYFYIWMGFDGRSVYVNGDCDRFVDEDCCSLLRAFPALAVRTQEASWEIFDQEIYDAGLDYVKTYFPNFYDKTEPIMEKALAAGKSVFKADSIDELAKLSGLDAAALKKTIDTYQGYCDSGLDEEFGKDAAKLTKLNPPFYCVYNRDISFLNSFGGVHTNSKMEVLDEDEQPIEGLYAVGTTGTELWPSFYTINVPGAANGNNVYSGRIAAQEAMSL